jgi:hypothetical protein
MTNEDHDKIIEIHTIVKRMDNELFGPYGKIKEMDSRISQNSEDILKGKTVVKFLGTVVGIFGGLIIKHFWWKSS